MKKYENFCAALNNLKDIYRYDEPYNNVIITGSPKLIIKTAYQASMIFDETTWLAALQARNNVSHSYNSDIALDIVRQTKKQFYNLFCELKKTVDENWI